MLRKMVNLMYSIVLFYFLKGTTFINSSDVPAKTMKWLNVRQKIYAFPIFDVIFSAYLSHNT